MDLSIYLYLVTEIETNLQHSCNLVVWTELIYGRKKSEGRWNKNCSLRKCSGKLEGVIHTYNEKGKKWVLLQEKKIVEHPNINLHTV